MATQQKRLLSSEKSKVATIKTSSLANVLATPTAWSSLPQTTREHLYALLPPPQADEPPHNPDVNPMMTRYRQYIEEELGRWQSDLENGLEMKKWREDGVKAGRERLQGKYDEWREAQREEMWGPRGDSGSEGNEGRENVSGGGNEGHGEGGAESDGSKGREEGKR